MMGLSARTAIRAAGYWPLAVLPPLVVVLGRAMLPANVNAYCRYIYDDPQNATEYLEAYRTDVFAMHTAGLAWAALLGMVAGALVMYPYRPPAVRSGRRLLGRFAAAAACGLVLALVDLSVVLPAAPSRLAFPQSCWGDSAILHPLSLGDGSVRAVVLCAVVDVSLFSVIGAGLAAVAGGRAVAVLFAGVLALATFLYLEKDRLPSGALGSLTYVVLVVVAIPSWHWAAVWFLTINGHPVDGLALTLAAAAVTVLLGYWADRRRPRGSCRTASPGPFRRQVGGGRGGLGG